MLARFHAAITGGAPLGTARELIVRGDVDELDRLGVYAHAYTARIAGVLAHDYPKLATLFDLAALTSDYLRAHPPAHPSLREVGAHLSRFLAARGMALHFAELAALERARTEVFDGPDASPLARGDLESLDPVAFPALPLALVPSSRVIALTTNADDIWDAIESEREPPAPEARDRVVLVWRREYTVVHRTLDADEARVIPALATGTTFGDVCELLDAPAERAIALLVRWLDAQCLRR
ncbi:MAG TPA: putative DNA-binding domain-containing protein [Kofleriaceae bacterium]